MANSEEGGRAKMSVKDNYSYELYLLDWSRNFGMTDEAITTVYIKGTPAAYPLRRLSRAEFEEAVGNLAELDRLYEEANSANNIPEILRIERLQFPLEVELFQ